MTPVQKKRLAHVVQVLGTIKHVATDLRSPAEKALGLEPGELYGADEESYTETRKNIEGYDVVFLEDDTSGNVEAWVKGLGTVDSQASFEHYDQVAKVREILKRVRAGEDLKAVRKDLAKFAAIKTAEPSANWNRIVRLFADAVWANCYMYAVDESTGENSGGTPSDDVPVHLKRAPWGAGSEITDYVPETPEAFVQATEKDIIAAWGKDAVLEDAEAFMAETGENEKTYGWYLAMQDMGHGVGLHDYGYDSKLKPYGSNAENVMGYFWMEGDKIKFAVDGGSGIYSSVPEIDVTDELGHLLVGRQ